MTLQEVNRVLHFLSATYGDRFTLQDETPDAWQFILRDLDMDSATYAVERHVNEASWPPTPADVLRLARTRRVRCPLHGHAQPCGKCAHEAACA